MLVSACSTVAPTLPAGSAGWPDAAYGPEVAVPTQDDIFAVTPAMQTYLRTEAAREIRVRGAYRGLVEALYQQGRLRLEYDSSRTRTAAEAFEARQGDCLSLVVMTAALARHLGLAVRYQDMETEVWERREEAALDLRIGHVNILLGHDSGAVRSAGSGTTWLLVDFMPSPELNPRLGRPVEESRIVAMWLNNRASEALVRGDLRTAYWHAKAALQADPRFAHGWNTLGVVHSRHGLAAEAQAALREALRQDNRHTAAMANLVGVLMQQGLDAEAEQWLQRHRALQPDNPMTLFTRAQQALDRQEWSQARRLLQRALAQGGDWHELHFALARAYAGLRLPELAERHLALAEQHGSSPAVRSRYARKLEMLRATRLQ